ncbi:MAG: DUF4426 domain-containing protein [Xanthomonadales bacterium]|nr:DUF4426 domain-containing protein [Xanthomonadales bacterium]
MKSLIATLLIFASLLTPLSGVAQQSQDFGNYVVHYNALTTSFLPPEVAKTYGIQRSSSRALLNVTVLKKVMDTPGSPVSANVDVSAINLTGQRRDIEMREIREPKGAIYHLGVFPVHNRELYRFTVQVNVEGEKNPLLVKFQQQFFTE